MICAPFRVIFNCQVQKALGCKNNPLAYDITAACSGFMLGLVSAACHIRGNRFFNYAIKEVLVTIPRLNAIKPRLYKLQEEAFVMF